jgi:hypothetical protein
MIQALIVKAVIGGVMKHIEKASDKRIAKTHHKRIKALEKLAHPPQEYVCCKKCGCEIAKTKKGKNAKSRK